MSPRPFVRAARFHRGVATNNIFFCVFIIIYLFFIFFSCRERERLFVVINSAVQLEKKKKQLYKKNF